MKQILAILTLILLTSCGLRSGKTDVCMCTDINSGGRSFRSAGSSEKQNDVNPVPVVSISLTERSGKMLTW